MKRIFVILALLTIPVFSQESLNYRNLITQTQNNFTLYTWDILPVGTGLAQQALAVEGSTFQLYTFHKTAGTSFLLATKTVGAYLPTGDINVVTTDPTGDKWGVKRTRIDKPFTVTAVVSGLMKDATYPEASRKVLMEQHIERYPNNLLSLLASAVLANSPLVTTPILAGAQDRVATTTTVDFPNSSFLKEDPFSTKGEEHFVLHALADGLIAQTQLDSDFVQIWPKAKASLTGLVPNTIYKGAMPSITVKLENLYPSSTTDVVAYPNADPTKVVSLMTQKYIWDDKVNRTDTLTIKDYDYAFPTNGSYTVRVITTDPFGVTELVNLTPIIVNRTLTVRAMQVGK